MTRPWTKGPLQAFGEHCAHVEPFVYAVSERNPKGVIAGYPTPIARYRKRADAKLGSLTPRMAEAILASGEHECLTKCGECVWCVQQELRAMIDEAEGDE